MEKPIEDVYEILQNIVHLVKKVVIILSRIPIKSYLKIIEFQQEIQHFRMVEVYGQKVS